MTLTLKEKLKRLREMERGDSPDDWWSASAEMPELAPPEKPKRIPRIAITQPTNATESRTLKVAQERERRPCKECGTVFLPSRRTQTFCSKSCNQKSRYRDEMGRDKTRTCECGTVFEATHGNQRLCIVCKNKPKPNGTTPEYRSAYRRKKRNERLQRLICARPGCGLLFRQKDPREKYCCRKCQQREKERNRRERLKAEGARHCGTA